MNTIDLDNLLVLGLETEARFPYEDVKLINDWGFNIRTGGDVKVWMRMKTCGRQFLAFRLAYHHEIMTDTVRFHAIKWIPE